MPWQPFFYKIALVKQTDKNRQTRTKMKRKTKTGCHIMDEQLIKSLWMPRKYLQQCLDIFNYKDVKQIFTRMSWNIYKDIKEIFTRMSWNIYKNVQKYFKDVQKYIQGCPEIFTRISRKYVQEYNEIFTGCQGNI